MSALASRLLEAARQGRAYVEAASTRLYDGSDGQSKRDRAARALVFIDQAITDGEAAGLRHGEELPAAPAPPACARCRYWDGERDPARPGNLLGDCRRRAPVLGADSMQQGWPTIHRTLWCGEFQAIDAGGAL